MPSEKVKTERGVDDRIRIDTYSFAFDYSLSIPPILSPLLLLFAYLSI